jgi:hypothetical protein
MLWKKKEAYADSIIKGIEKSHARGFILKERPLMPSLN